MIFLLPFKNKTTEKLFLKHRVGFILLKKIHRAGQLAAVAGQMGKQ
jgi:hypothetical protein